MMNSLRQRARALPAVAQRDKQTYCNQLEQLQIAESARLMIKVAALVVARRSSGSLRREAARCE
jgi:hypothetical protein